MTVQYFTLFSSDLPWLKLCVCVIMMKINIYEYVRLTDLSKITLPYSFSIIVFKLTIEALQKDAANSIVIFIDNNKLGWVYKEYGM